MWRSFTGDEPNRKSKISAFFDTMEQGSKCWSCLEQWEMIGMCETMYVFSRRERQAPPEVPAALDFATLERSMQMLNTTDQRDVMFCLTKMPQPGKGRSLSDADAWKQWYDVHLRPWRGAQRDGVDDAMRTGDLWRLRKFVRERLVFAYDVCSQLDDSLPLEVPPAWQTRWWMASATSSKTKEGFAMVLPQRKEGLDELQAAGSSPSFES